MNNEKQNEIVSYEQKYNKLLEKYQKLEKRIEKITTLSDKQTNNALNEIIKYKKFNNRLNLIIKHSDKQSKKLLTQKDDIEREKEYENILAHQAKMNSILELIENIAHQWRQPLSIISSISSGMALKLDLEDFTKDDLVDSLSKITNITQDLSQTIDKLRDLINENDEKEITQTKKTLGKVLAIIDEKIIENKIIIDFDIEDFEIKIHESYLIQVLLNILNNSIEALHENETKNKIIKIKIAKINNIMFIDIIDNGGGIDKKHIDKIYDLYFTTKHKSQGTGIGLYGVYQIVTKNLKGTIQSKNKKIHSQTGLQTLIKIPFD